jgi:hypothetical protein
MFHTSWASEKRVATVGHRKIRTQAIAKEGEDQETTYVADLNSLGYSVVKLLAYIGRLSFVEAGSVAKVVNRQSTGEQQYSLRSSANNGVNEPRRTLS